MGIFSRSKKGSKKAKQGSSSSSKHLSEKPTTFSLPQNTYIYKPLGPSGSQIRLLSISPGTPPGEIRATIQTDPAGHRIVVDNQSFYVSGNLLNALNTLRGPKEARVVWLDAICINQQDHAERDSQDTLIAKICFRAEQVLCWPVEDCLDNNLALAAILNSTLRPPKAQSGRSSSNEMRSNDAMIDSWMNDYECLAIGRLLGREWFCRAWIVQEIAYAKEAIMLCGDREMNWEEFVESVRMVQSKLDHVGNGLRSSPLHGTDLNALGNFNNSPSIDLMNSLEDVFVKSSKAAIVGRRIALQTLVSDLAPLQATDPRDKFFALLSLVKDGQPLHTLPQQPENSQRGFNLLTADYRRNNLDVYSDFISRSIRTSGSLDVITRTWAPFHRTKWQKKLDPDFRFRVPSWIAVAEDLPFGDLKKAWEGELMQKFCNMNAQVRFGVHKADGTYDGCLFAKGIVIGSITKLSTRMPDGIVPKDGLDMIGIERTSQKEVVKSSDFVWRMLCGNWDDRGHSLSSVYQYACNQILQRVSPSGSLDTVELLESKSEDCVRVFLQRVQAMTWNRKVSVVNSAKAGVKRQVGFVPSRSQVGDKICVLLGGSVPFVLRKHDADGRTCWELVGESYVEGQMDGETLGHLTKHEIVPQMQEFAIY